MVFSRRNVSGNAPSLGEQAQYVLIVIAIGDRAAGKGNQFISHIQPPALRIAIFDDARHHDGVFTSFFRAVANEGAERGVIGVEAGPQMAHEVLDLVDRDGVADAGVDAAAFVERAAAVDADQLALHVEQRAAGVARVDRRVDLDAIGVFEKAVPTGILIAMDAADQAEGHGRREVGGQQERVAHRQ